MKLVVINIDYKLKNIVDLLHDLFFICNIILVLGLDRFCSGFSSTPPRQCSAATRAFSLSSTPLALTEEEGSFLLAKKGQFDYHCIAVL